jgi:biotin operon repressor
MRTLPCGIRQLLQSPGYLLIAISGRRLAKELGTNRTDVWPLVERSEMALQGVLWGGED